MSNGISIWNGYPINGDIKALHRITESEVILLPKNDIFNVLSAEGESHVTSGVNASLVEAFNEAVNALPCKLDKVEELLVDLRLGNGNTREELSSVSKMLSNIKMTLGICLDESFGNSHRVVLVASVKT